MPISGLLVTLRDGAERNSAQELMHTRMELTVGAMNDRWLPVALEARDDEHSREVHDWLMTLPGVEYVDVVSVNFEEPDLIPTDSEQPQMERIIGGLPESAGKVSALPVSALND
jgi:hypothetical protein